MGRKEMGRGGEGWPARCRRRALLDLAPREPEDEDGRERQDRTGRFEGVRVAKSGAPRRGRGAIADAWRRSPVGSGGMGVGGVTVPSRSSSVHSFK